MWETEIKKTFRTFEKYNNYILEKEINNTLAKKLRTVEKKKETCERKKNV
jgi:hypothetical protein